LLYIWIGKVSFSPEEVKSRKAMKMPETQQFAEAILSSDKTELYLLTGLALSVFVVNMCLGWTFQRDFCKKELGLTDLFECPVPLFDDFPLQNIRYNIWTLINALFAPFLIAAIVDVFSRFWNLNELHYVKHESHVPADPSERVKTWLEALKSSSFWKEPFFWFGVLYLLSFTVFTVLIFGEILKTVDWLNPWQLILWFTIVNGVLFLGAAISGVAFLMRSRSHFDVGTGRRSSSTKQEPEKLNVSDLEKAIFITTVVVPGFYTIYYIIAGWVFFGNFCEGSTECKHPASFLVDGAGYLNFELFNALLAFSGILIVPATLLHLFNAGSKSFSKQVPQKAVE
jgi:hypothetical protein